MNAVKRISLLVGCGFLPAAAPAAEKAPTPFVFASASPLSGDWHGADGHVAQVFSPAAGQWQVNLLRQFDRPDPKPLAILQGEGRSEAITFAGDGWAGTVESGHLVLKSPGGAFRLQRMSRPPPTLGAAPPLGAIVLFDGRTLDAWAKKAGKEWLKPDGPAAWKLVTVDGDPVMEVVSGADSLISRQSFGDCQVHLEFRTLGAPTNSGVYLQTRYEVNINESYGRLEGNPNGGLDNCSDVKPGIGASRPPCEWQTFDIEFVAPRFDADGKKTANARATVLLNGTTIYDRQELNPPKGAAGRLGEARTGPLMLQEHGQPVQFRNIWVLEKVAPDRSRSSSAETRWNLDAPSGAGNVAAGIPLSRSPALSPP